MNMRKSRRQPLKIRTAVRTDAKRIHDLIERYMQEGRLLPRQLSELTSHIGRFVVGVDGRGSIIAGKDERSAPPGTADRVDVVLGNAVAADLPQ